MADYFLLSSTVKSSGSLSSFQLHFAQYQTVLVVFRGKVETEKKKDLWSETTRHTKKKTEHRLILPFRNEYRGQASTLLISCVGGVWGIKSVCLCLCVNLRFLDMFAYEYEQTTQPFQA